MNNPPSSRPAPAGLRRPCRRTARASVRGRAVSAGFTLTEILIAIVLIVLVGGLAMANVFNLANMIDKEPPEKIIHAAIREARFDAMQSSTTVYLTYNGDDQNFEISDDKGNLLDEIASNANPDVGNLTVTFARILPMKDATSDYKSSMDNPDLEAKESTTLMIHGSGVSAPVQVDMKDGSVESKFYLDAFSEGPPPEPPPASDAILNSNK